ncbi:MAG: anaerobic glycerol-3-phosphate dehydrogenase subunit C [Bacteroidales bacterium]|nr:anaerobic glycerol-3-phosphate dehydrogenase subunit C [Bacteroidales bacterium]
MDLMQERTESINNLEQCMKCTICTAYCPVVPVRPEYPGPKQAGPDGERLRIKNGFYYDEALKYCLNCKRCEAACPSGVKIADIIHSAREQFSTHKPGLREFILANTDLMGTVARPFAPIVNGVVSTSVAKLAMDSILGVDKHRKFPKYQFKGFEGWFKKEKASSQASFKNQIAFFHGCSTEFQHPEVGKAFVEIMNAIGYGVNLLDEQCCGVAMISNGFFKAAKKHAKNNIKEFEKAVANGLPIVTTASSCTLTMRDEYPSVLKIDNSSVRESIVLVEKFLYELIDEGKVKLAFKPSYSAKINYHIPCHMEKLGWSIYTKKLMEMIPGLEFTTLDSRSCGIAGTYGFKKENYEVSQAIGKPLFDAIKANKPDFVVSECDTCKWQIEMSTGYTVKNPILVIYEALDIEKTIELNK